MRREVFIISILMERAVATMPLDYGRCPPWLFERMKKLARGIVITIVENFGPDEFLNRLAHPAWFQSFGCVLAFDWNSSGLTTTVMAALKEALRGLESELGIFVCGGKGKTSRKTPREIEEYGTNFTFSFTPYLIFASKIAAKVDSCLIQDGFQIYHHNFLFTKSGRWIVIQQGMNSDFQAARRYHWLEKEKKDFIEEPHSGIASLIKVKPLNLTAKTSEENRKISLEMVQNNFKSLEKDLKLITPYLNNFSKEKELILPSDEIIPQPPQDLKPDNPYLKKILFILTERKPKSYLELLFQYGVGPKTIRALSLIGELIYGAEPSYQDPARYSFAHGGKDHIPFPVDCKTYDKTIEIMEKGIKRSNISLREKENALRRLKEIK